MSRGGRDEREKDGVQSHRQRVDIKRNGPGKARRDRAAAGGHPGSLLWVIRLEVGG